MAELDAYPAVIISQRGGKHPPGAYFCARGLPKRPPEPYNKKVRDNLPVWTLKDIDQDGESCFGAEARPADGNQDGGEPLQQEPRPRSAAQSAHGPHLGDTKTLDATFSATVSTLDKSVQKGVLHKNTASRYKARLNARVKAAKTATKTASK